MNASKVHVMMIAVAACALLLSGCLGWPAAPGAGPTAPAATERPSPSPTSTPTATPLPPTATPLPTATLQPTTDWSNLRCVPTNPEDISRCPQSPSPVTEKAAFVDWFARWARQMNTYKPAASVAYGATSIDQYGSRYDILTISSGGLAGTFWFAGEDGQPILVMAMANGIVDANGLYHGQYNLVVLVNQNSYKGPIGGQISPEEQIACLQPGTAAYLATLNMHEDASNYLEKAVSENYPDGVLADASTISVGYIWLMMK